MLNKVILSIAALLVGSNAALADHCKKSNPAGGEIPVDCVHPEREKIEAPGPVESTLPGVNQQEVDAILKHIEEREQQIEAPVPVAPR